MSAYANFQHMTQISNNEPVRKSVTLPLHHRGAKQTTKQRTSAYTPEEGLGFVQQSLVGFVVGVGKEWLPVVGNRSGVHGVTMVLGGDEAAAGSVVRARLVVAAVTVTEGRGRLQLLVGHKGKTK